MLTNIKVAFAVLLFTSLLMHNSALAQRLDSATISKLPAARQTEVYSLVKQANASKTAGFITIIAGGSLFLVGAIFSTVDDINNSNRGNYDHRFGAGDFMMVTGAVAAASGTLFFLKLHRLRNEARAIIRMHQPDKYLPGRTSVALPAFKNLGIGIAFTIGK